MDFLTSVMTPILVALISSGVVGKLIQRKFDNNDLCKKIDGLSERIDKNQAETYRTRILRFNGEVKRGTHHDEEEFNDILNAIDGYERYCKEHPNYPNSKAVLAIENLKRVYQKLIQTNGF